MNDLFVGCVLVVKGNVVGNAFGKQEDVLHDERIFSAHFVYGHILDIDAVKQNLSFRTVVKTGHEFHKHGFARARFAHDTHSSAVRNFKVYLVQSLLSVVKTHGYVFERNRRFFGYGQRIFLVHDSLGTVCKLKITFCAHHAVPNISYLPCHKDNVGVNGKAIRGESREFAYAEIAFYGKEDTQNYGHDAYRFAKEGKYHGIFGACSRKVDVVVAECRIAFFKTFGFVGFGRKTTYNPDSVYVFLYVSA